MGLKGTQRNIPVIDQRILTYNLSGVSYLH
jgi:hypothetical protein